MIKFQIYDPEVRVDKRGGGFIFMCDIDEGQWEAIKDVNDPVNHNKVFTVLLLDAKETETVEKKMEEI